MSNQPARWGIIFMGMGGPDSVNDIKEFLYNIFSDRSIIRLPGGAIFQKPFAKMISNLRYKKVQAHYNLIGGSSPLLKWTEAQLNHVKNELSGKSTEYRYYIGMRYFKPYIKSAVKEAINDKCDALLFLPMYPQFSTATTGSSFNEAKKELNKYPDVKAVFINDFHDNNDYIALLKSYIEKNITDNDILLFSAHSLPKKFVDEGDPYVDQIEKTAKLSAGNREYFLSYQSRTGPVEWVGPDTVEEVKRLLNEDKRNIFIVPISFVCDHIETLYEIDIELKDLFDDHDKKRIKRMPMFNDDPVFGSCLAKLIRDKIN